eukprot:scaffold18815_cov116-Isochrysis_galbana.AAC.8
MALYSLGVLYPWTRVLGARECSGLYRFVRIVARPSVGRRLTAADVKGNSRAAVRGRMPRGDNGCRIRSAACVLSCMRVRTVRMRHPGSPGLPHPAPALRFVR